MGNRPNNKREAVQEKAAKPSRAASSRAAEGLFRFLLFMTERHPILLWTGTWFSMVLVSWVAISAIIYTNPAPLEIAESPQPEAVSPSPQPESQFQPRRPATSIGLLAAVALSCAATTALLAHQLRPVKPAPKRAIKRISDPKAVTRPTAIQTERVSRQATQSSDRPVRPASPTPKPKPVPVAAAQPAAKSAVRTAKVETLKPVAQPKVTVLPADESHSIDWGDANLAEMMDIRKRESISFEL